ncbi:MAG TPA: cytochrome P450 [Terriglobales bacterium]|nr:cytochrome P450 [Terriglobales bacterium]
MPSHPTNPAIRLLDGAFYAADPHPHLTWMRRHAPVYWDEAAQVWGIARYADILAISKDPHTFSNSAGNRPDVPALPYMISMDDPLHRQRRALVNKGFTPRQVAEREPRIRAIAAELIAQAREREQFDFVADIAAWLPLMVIGDLLGVDASHYRDLLRWSDEMVIGSGSTCEATVARANQAFLEYADYQAKVIADRRARPREDLVSILVHAEIDGERLSDDAILWELLLILIGGDETTRHVLSGGMYQLLLHAEPWQRLVSDPTRAASAVEEMLRWVTPVQNMSRLLRRDATVGGETMRAGDKLVLLYPSANRDEAVFADPFRFDIGRTPNDHLAFGYGAHFCLGASLARLEIKIFLEEMIAGLPAVELASDTPPHYRVSNFITGIEALPVRARG